MHRIMPKGFEIASVSAMRKGSHQGFAQVVDMGIDRRSVQKVLYAVPNRSAVHAGPSGEQLHVGLFEGSDIIVAEPATLQPHAVDHSDFGTCSSSRYDDDKGRHIGRHARHAADKGMPSDGDKMVHGAVPTHVDMVFNMDVSGELRVVGDDAVASDPTIMSDVCAHEEQVVVCDLGDSAAVGRAGMHRHHLAEHVAFPDDQPRPLALILEVLRLRTQDSLGVHFALLAQQGYSDDGGLMVQPATIAQHNVGTDDAVRADLDVAPDPGARIDNRCGVDDIGQRASPATNQLITQ